MNYEIVRQVIVIIMMICLISVHFSCTTASHRQTEKTFEVVERLMNSHPDTALVLLEGIEYPEMLDNSLYYKYILLLVQAKNKNNKDICDDTAVREAAAYYTKVNDEPNMAVARFYSGRIYKCVEDYKNAINEYLVAEELAKKMENSYLLALINYDVASIYSSQLNEEKALEHYILSKEYFSKANNEKQEYNVLNAIGNVYLQMDPPQGEKALDLYDQVLEHAIQEKDTIRISVCLNNLSVAYRAIGDYENAKKYIKESIALDQRNETLIKNYNNLSKIYIAMNEPDSVILTLNAISGIVENNQNKFELYNYYNLLYDVLEQKGDYKAALAHYKTSQEYLTQIYDENNEKSILEIQHRYDKTRVENLYHQTIIKKQRLQIWVAFSLLLAFIIVVVSVVLYKNNKRKKLEAESRIEALNNLLSDSNKSNERFRNMVIAELELTKKVAYIHATDSNKGKRVISEYDTLFNRNLRNVLDWQNLYKLIDELYPGFRKTFDEHYPDLLEKEKQMCYLTKAGFKTNEIAYLLEYSRESADTLKCNIRKKSGFNSMAEFSDFLNKL